MNSKNVDNSQLDLYDIFQENFAIKKRANEQIKKKNQLEDKIYKESMLFQIPRRDFAEVENIIALKKNLEFYFYELLPLFIQEAIIRGETQLESIDYNRLGLSIKNDLYYILHKSKFFVSQYDGHHYYFPSDSDDCKFNLYLKNFIEQYNLGEMNEKFLSDNVYTVELQASFKDLVYACYVGEEWVKYLEDACIDLLSDYFNEEQLKSYKKGRRL